MLFGGGSDAGLLPDVSKSIKQEISDKARAKELVKIHEEMVEEGQKFAKDLTEALKEANKFNRVRGTETSEFEASFAELEQKRVTRRDRVIEDLFVLRSKMSEEEWNLTYGAALERAPETEEIGK